MRPRLCAIVVLMLSLLLGLNFPARADSPAGLPPKFDLRDLGCVTPIKQQSGGTCWAHGTMAALESHLLVTGLWKASGQPGHPCLSEYHLDWWNGFNKHKNEDVDDPAQNDKTGLRVHVGGDYRVAAAYFSRGDGVVLVPRIKDNAPDAKAWFAKAPEKLEPSYQRFYVRDVEWFTVGPNLENINIIKRRIMTEGAIGTAYAVGKNFLSKDFVHYQPVDSPAKPNHAVAIVGWDDNKVSADPEKKAPGPGAWLIKNSWGVKRGDAGYYWISYFDKCCGRDPEMGAVAFRNLEPMIYSQVYLHDYHGWRDTLPKISKAMNAFTATGRQQLRAVGFYTAKDKVNYTARIFGRFEKGQLGDELAAQTGTSRFTGLHTVNLDMPVWLQDKDKFYVSLDVSDGGQAIDRTSVIPVLLGQQKKAGSGPPTVLSKAKSGESFYFDGGAWKDLYDYDLGNPDWNKTANFCMKALAVSYPAAAAKVAEAKAQP